MAIFYIHAVQDNNQELLNTWNEAGMTEEVNV